MELQRQKQIAKFWGVPSSRLIFLLKQQCPGFGFHLNFSHFAGKSSTHLWPLITLNSALFHSVTQQCYRLSQSQMWCHWPTLCYLSSSLKENRTWISPDIAWCKITVPSVWCYLMCEILSGMFGCCLCSNCNYMHKATPYRNINISKNICRQTNKCSHTHTVFFYSTASRASGMFSVPPSLIITSLIKVRAVVKRTNPLTSGELSLLVHLGSWCVVSNTVACNKPVN